MYGTKHSTMKNCNVSHSKQSGLLVNYGGLMTIDGNGTTIHHNVTDGDSYDYGLRVIFQFKSIQFSILFETIVVNAKRVVVVWSTHVFLMFSCFDKTYGNR